MLKKLSEITNPDPELSGLEIFDPATNSSRQLTVQDHYSAVAEIELASRVSGPVRLVFERARNAFLYAWFAHDLVALAEGQAYAALELAAREYVQNMLGVEVSGSMAEQLKAAQRSGAFEKFPVPPDIEIDTDAYVRTTINSVLRSRNHLAHGTMHVGTPGAVLAALQTCAKLIDQLAASATSNTSRTLPTPR